MGDRRLSTVNSSPGAGGFALPGVRRGSSGKKNSGSISRTRSRVKSFTSSFKVGADSGLYKLGRRLRRATLETNIKRINIEKAKAEKKRKCVSGKSEKRAKLVVSSFHF